MKPLEVKYLFKRILFESEEKIVELISVCEEEHYDNKVSIKILASSLKETSIFKASWKHLKEINNSPKFKQYISKESALDICKRIQAYQESDL